MIKKIIFSIIYFIIASNNLYSQKVVRVGAFNFYPAIFQDNDGEIKGFYVDAFHEIEAKENIQFHYIFGTWGEGLERIQNDEIDVMVSVAYTDERATYMDYSSTPLITVWGDVYVKEATEIHGILDLEGKTIAVMKSDINGEQLKVLTEKMLINCNFIEKADFQGVFKSIASNEVDAGVVNNTFGAGKSEEYDIRSSGIVFNPFDIHLTVQKNKNAELLNLFDKYLDDWKHDVNSVYNISRQKWSHGKVGAIQIIPKWLKNSLFLIIGITILLVVFVVLLRNRVKKATIKIEESESKFRELYEKSGDAIVINQNGVIVDFNQAMVKLFGYHSKDEFMGTHPSQLSPEFQPDGKSSFEKVEVLLNLAAINGTYRFEWMHKKSDGECFLCEILVTMIIDEPNDRIFHGVIREITSYKQTEQELIVAKEKAEKNELEIRELKMQSDLILDVAGEGIYGIDLEGNTTFINPAAAKMIGWEIHEIIGKNQHQEVHHTKANGTPYPSDICPIFLAYKDGKTHRKDDEMFWKKDGSSFPVEYISTPMRDENNLIVGAVITFKDISERKEEEQKLISAKEKAEESDQLKTEFINNMSHEIRTPMNGILGFSEMLDNNDLSVEKRANFIKIIQSSGQQLLNVIDDILEISRLGTKQVKIIESDVCLNDVMLELFSTFYLKAKEENKPLYLKKALSDKQSTIRLDKTKLNKILSNLLENALKFTNEGFIEFGYQLKNNKIELYVKDTGIGIDKSKHESIFERFSQGEKDLSKKVGGLGLGLSIAKENAELLGGSIHLESKVLVGSTFYVTIPYKPVYKVNDAEKAKTTPKNTILIAEDEEINQLYLETLLKDGIGLDCKIIHVTNGKDAIDACKENKTIDLVLMDLKMPVLNGFEATKLIKKLCPNLPIIAQTAYSTLKEKEESIEAGCDEFISKPINQQSFKRILDKYLIIK